MDTDNNCNYETVLVIFQPNIITIDTIMFIAQHERFD